MVSPPTAVAGKKDEGRQKAAREFERAEAVVLPPGIGDPPGRVVRSVAGGETGRRFDALESIVVLPEEFNKVASNVPFPSSSRNPVTVVTTAPPPPPQQQSMMYDSSYYAPYMPYPDMYANQEMHSSPYPVCADWRNTGQCRRHQCRYLHVDRRGGVGGAVAKHPPPPPPPPPPPTTSVKDVPCRYHGSGTCTKGDRCPFRHFEVSPSWSDQYQMSVAPYHSYSGYGTASGAEPPDVPRHPDWGTGWSGKGGVLQAVLAGRAPPPPPPKKNSAAASPKAGTSSTPSSASGPDKVATVRTKLLALNRTPSFFPTLKAVLKTFSPEDSGVLLGLGANSIGLTRFKSVLLKRTLRHCQEGDHLATLDTLIEWERALARWLPPVSDDYVRCFELKMCDRLLEVVRCMVSSPFSRYRLPEGAGAEAARTDPAAGILAHWAPHSGQAIHRDMLCEWPDSSTTVPTAPRDPTALFSHDSGVSWGPPTHHLWPVTFRCRTQLLFFAGIRKPHLQLPLSLAAGVMSFVPPVSPSDMPKSEAVAGVHDFLDLLCAVLAHYSLNCLGVTDAVAVAEAKERLGETVWPLILSVFNESCAPKLTGMFLQMEAEDLLLDIVNNRRFIESLHEAWSVWETSIQTGDM